ncbi:MAG: hypothetical protein LUB61_02035 [Eggerthellaceae bacterium]|nr:hypothetical protein [Eggerthellaceae bacterium]
MDFQYMDESRDRKISDPFGPRRQATFKGLEYKVPKGWRELDLSDVIIESDGYVIYENDGKTCWITVSGMKGDEIRSSNEAVEARMESINRMYRVLKATYEPIYDTVNEEFSLSAYRFTIFENSDEPSSPEKQISYYIYVRTPNTGYEIASRTESEDPTFVMSFIKTVRLNQAPHPEC